MAVVLTFDSSYLAIIVMVLIDLSFDTGAEHLIKFIIHAGDTSVDASGTYTHGKHTLHVNNRITTE